MPDPTATKPDDLAWVAAAVRYALAILGTQLAAMDLVDNTVWDQITPALIALGTILYGVFRTRKASVEKAVIKEDAKFYQARTEQLTEEVAKHRS